MADKSFPGPVGSPTEAMDWADWLDWAGPITGAGVIHESSNSLRVFADSTGLQVKVLPGRVNVYGPQRRVESQITLPVDGGSGNPRIDTVVARRLGVAAGGGIEVVVKKGVPSSSNAQPPALTQEPHGIWEVALADIDVSASAATIVANNITDRRSFISEDPVPVGSGTLFFGADAPPGWMFPRGQLLSRTQYPELFAVIGTTYNTGGEPSTQFRMPNSSGRAPVGLDPSQTEFNTLGKRGGAKTHTLTGAEMPSHVHNQVIAAGTGSAVNVRRNYAGEGPSLLYPQGISTDPAGGGQPHNNLSPYITVNFIIKVV